MMSGSHVKTLVLSSDEVGCEGVAEGSDAQLQVFLLEHNNPVGGAFQLGSAVQKIIKLKLMRACRLRNTSPKDLKHRD